jgi:hypothetical protein
LSLLKLHKLLPVHWLLFCWLLLMLSVLFQLLRLWFQVLVLILFAAAGGGSWRFSCYCFYASVLMALLLVTGHK